MDYIRENYTNTIGFVIVNVSPIHLTLNYVYVAGHVVHTTQEEIVDFVHKERATVGHIRE